MRHATRHVLQSGVNFGLLEGAHNLGGWAAARDAAGTVKVVAIGDSIGDGYQFTTLDDTNLWINRLPKLLRAGTGRARPSDKTYETYRCAYGAQPPTNNYHWTYVGGAFVGGFGLGSVTRAFNADADRATVTIPANCSSLDVFYTGTTTSGTMQVRVNTVLVDSWATAQASSLNGRMRRITLTPSASPITVEIRRLAAGASVFLDAVFPNFGNETDDIALYDSCFGGRKASDWNSYDGGTLVQEIVAAADPDLVIVSGDAAGWVAGDNAATIESSLNTLIDKVRTGKADVDVLVYLMYDIGGTAAGATYAQYRTAVFAAAAAKGCAVIDLYPAIGKLTAGHRYNAGDDTHTNDAGQIAIGNAIAHHLLSVH